VAGLASLRPRWGYATRIALRELGRRADAALPEAHEGHRFASQAEGFRPAAVTAPRHPSPPGTSATRASTPYRWPAPARPGAMYLRNSG